MMWIRRPLAILLALFFFLFFLVSLVILRVNSTFLNPSFVVKEIHKADIFTFVYDDLIPAAIEENRADIPKLPWGIPLTPEDGVAAARQIAPSEWLQGQTEGTIKQVWPYLTGDRDSFTIHVPLSDRMKVAVPVVKDVLRDSSVYSIASNKEFVAEMDKYLADFGELPLGMSVSGQQAASLAVWLAPPDWLQQQVERAIDEVTPYISGETDSFKVTAPLSDRVEAGLSAVKDLLRQVNAYQLAYKALLGPFVQDYIGQMATLPFGITISSEEIESALREVVPPDWLQKQAERIIDELTPYMTGKATSFQISLPLSERVEVAGGVIEELADRKLRQLFDSLPPCSIDGALKLVKEGLSGALPGCRPAVYSLEEIKRGLGVEDPDITLEELSNLVGYDLSPLTAPITYESIKQLAGIDISGEVKRAIIDVLPSQWTFTDADLRRYLSPKDEKTLDDALRIVREGWTYTQADLRSDLASISDVDAVDVLDQVRDNVHNGWTFTDIDLRKLVREGDPQALQQLDLARHILSLLRRLLPLTYLIGALLLLLIGMLGGRRLVSKVRWAAAVLGISALTAFIITGPVYNWVLRPLLDLLLDKATERAEGFQILAAEKGIDIAKTVAGDFISGINRQALLFLMVALAVIALSILWPRWTDKRKPATSESESNNSTSDTPQGA